MPKISLLVPFLSDDGIRARVWAWLEDYWANELPDAELILGHDTGEGIFSKTRAVNEAFARSTGDVIVILDADGYLDGRVIEHCAERLRHARRHGARLWFVPYRFMFRLTAAATEELLGSHCYDPCRFPDEPDDDVIEPHDASGPGLASHYGALIQIMPREAFELVGGMDEHFIGWGGEDISFLRALTTLWSRPKHTHNAVFHLWHPKIIGRGAVNPFLRMWAGQQWRGANDHLANRYNAATGHPTEMRNLLDEL